MAGIWPVDWPPMIGTRPDDRAANAAPVPVNARARSWTDDGTADTAATTPDTVTWSGARPHNAAARVAAARVTAVRRPIIRLVYNHAAWRRIIINRARAANDTAARGRWRIKAARRTPRADIGASWRANGIAPWCCSWRFGSRRKRCQRKLGRLVAKGIGGAGAVKGKIPRLVGWR